MTEVMFMICETWRKIQFFNKILCTAKPSYQKKIATFSSCREWQKVFNVLCPSDNSCILPKYFGEIQVYILSMLLILCELAVSIDSTHMAPGERARLERVSRKAVIV